MRTRSLTGITWNHTRGYLPLVAAAQRFADRDPDVEIVWHKRSLQEFADAPIERLAESFDLLVIDHPFVGYAARHPTLLPLDEYLPEEYLADQAANSVGRSFESYHFGGHLWALAIDAATPVSAHRPDLLERHGVTSAGDLGGIACAGEARSRRPSDDSRRRFDGVLHALSGSERGAVCQS